MVLTLVALLTGLVAPRILSWMDGARARAALDALRASVDAQPAQAFHAQRARRVTEHPPDWPLPAGWRLELAAPLQWEANGMAAGGRLRVWAGTELMADWVVQPVSGAVRAATGADGRFKTAADAS